MKTLCVNLLVYGWIATLFLAHAQEGPRITSTLKADRTVEISWPSSAQSFRLESSLTLGQSAFWQPVPQAPVLSGDRWGVRLVPLEPKKFFRLRKVSTTV